MENLTITITPSNINSSTFCVPEAEPSSFFNIVRITLFSLIILLSLLGNTAVILCVYKVPSMRSFTNILVCNAAFADLLITLVPNVHEVIDIVYYQGDWVLGGFMCSFLYMCIYLSVAATVLTLVFITIDRYFSVTMPYKKFMKLSDLPKVVGVIWSAAFCFSSPTVFIQKVIPFDGRMICIERWDSPFDVKESPKHYTIILFMFLYALPLTLMGLMYWAIARKLSKQYRALTKRLNEQGVETTSVRESTPRRDGYSPVTSENRNKVLADNLNRSIREDELKDQKNDNSSINGSRKSKHRSISIHKSTKRLKSQKTNSRQPSQSQRKLNTRNTRIIKMLFAVVLTFALCFLPVYVVQFFAFFHPYFIRCQYYMPRVAYFMGYLFQYANSAINPFLYFGFSQSYRKAFKKTFLKR
ncbi:cholecystokinin receptor type A-like [Clytia hemisphaerica]|uniref:cholecystokinin receptor type A-like n=1 Tax=Clytia hemisphaerica TaxID=252671 RepID=UPI0034D66342